MAERKQLSKKARFEVFKRDKFTCQYCGKSAPDVVLEVDHIKPVAEGGTNDILNLVTACFDCNRGKGKRELSDESAIKKQKKQLDELAERREQLELMYQWQLELIEEETDETDLVNDLIIAITGVGVNEKGEEFLRKYIGKFGIQAVLDAVRIAFSRYPSETTEQWEKAFSKIGGIAFNLTHKTCGQCIHNDGYSDYYHRVRCALDEGEDHFYTHKNSDAEYCDNYKSWHGDNDG